MALPYNAQQPTPVSGACGQRVDPEAYEQTPSGEGCDYGSLLAIAAAVFPDDLYIVQDSDGVNIYYEFSCAQTEELVTQLTAWRPDFNTRFDAQLVTIENAVRVPEPCCGPGATLAALMVVAALGRRNRANAH